MRKENKRMARFKKYVTIEGLMERNGFTVDAPDEAAADTQIREAAERMARKRVADTTCKVPKEHPGWQAAYVNAQAAVELPELVIEAA